MGSLERTAAAVYSLVFQWRACAAAAADRPSVIPPMDSPAPAPIPPDARTADGARGARGKRFRKVFMRVWFALAAGFVFYLYYSFRAGGFDPAVLRSDALVSVTDAPGAMTFTPVNHSGRASLILIPGGMVEPTAYAPLARSIAQNGHTVILLKLPWRIASLESQRRAVVQRVGDLITSGDPSTKWVVGGHSVGGVLACQVARDHADLLAGLVLIGTSHPRDFDLAHLSVESPKYPQRMTGWPLLQRSRPTQISCRHRHDGL